MGWGGVGWGGVLAHLVGRSIRVRLQTVGPRLLGLGVFGGGGGLAGGNHIFLFSSPVNEPGGCFFAWGNMTQLFSVFFFWGVAAPLIWSSQKGFPFFQGH